MCKDALFVTFGRCVDPIDISSERVDIFGFYRHDVGETRLLALIACIHIKEFFKMIRLH